jgi:hypothetical protein
MVMSAFDLEDRKKTARLAGLMYLGVIVFGILAQIIYMSFIVSDDAAKTANNIMDNEPLFRASNVIWLISEMFLLLLGLTLYIVLKRVNKNIALLMVLFVVLGVAIESINTLNRFAALQLLTDSHYLTVYSAEQLNAEVMFRLDLWEAGYSIAAIMSFGPWLIPAGYLIYKSGYFPKILGILAMIAGLGIFIEGFQSLLLPDYEVISYPGALLAVIGEFSVCGWLMVKRAKIPDENKEEKDDPKPVEEEKDTERES